MSVRPFERVSCTVAAASQLRWTTRTPSAMVLVKIAFEQSLSFFPRVEQWPADVATRINGELGPSALLRRDVRRGSRSIKKTHLT